MKNGFYLLFLILFFTSSINEAFSQMVRCGTDEYYESLFHADPEFAKKFKENQYKFKPAISRQFSRIATISDTIPLVVHIVANSAIQSMVTDDVIQSQIDVLNEDFMGLNADSVRIPSAFKPLYGSGKLFFKLAGTNPLDEPTNGIVRVINSNTFTQSSFNNAKFSSFGGSNAWDPTKYLNIWVVSFGSTGVLGFSVFPGDPRPLQYHGFVCDYRAFGRKASYLYPKFNKGRTTTHELGHFFNLFHIWNEESGNCTGSDFPDDFLNDDTPDQSIATQGNPDSLGVGVLKTDACSPTQPGIMYQNYMDYTDDVAIVMFTKGQQNRMEHALMTSPDRASLLSSNAYKLAKTYQYDARLLRIISPTTPICSSTFEPIVVLRNSGKANLNAVRIEYVLNNQIPVTYNWTGNLSPYTDTKVKLPKVWGKKGINSLIVYTSMPNDFVDENFTNDTAAIVIEVIEATPLSTMVESFSGPLFPPAKWKVINNDDDITWTKTETYGKNALGCVWYNDWNNYNYRRYDDLVTPSYSYSNKDSVFLTFNIAASTYSNPYSYINLDTLSILITRDCGNSFSTVYKKWGKELQTTDVTSIREFYPNQQQWRRDSVDLGMYLHTSEDQFQIYFRISGNHENNVFIDDIAIYTKTVPQSLKEKGYLISPTVFASQFSVWHYQLPRTLSSVKVFNSIGQIIWNKQFNQNASTSINIDLSAQPRGVYFVRLAYEDSQLNFTEQVIKY